MQHRDREKNTKSLIFFIGFCVLSGCSRPTFMQQARLVDDTVSTGVSHYWNAGDPIKGVLLGGVAGGAIGGVAGGPVGAAGGAGVGAVWGGSLGRYLERETTLAEKLQRRHITVVELGDQILLVLPSKQIFANKSGRMTMSAYAVLNLVSHFIDQYPNISVRVKGHVNDIDTGKRDHRRLAFALSTCQARAVANYLWAKGTDTRLIYAVGRGGSEPVQRIETGWLEDNMNDRIEITLEKLHA